MGEFFLRSGKGFIDYITMIGFEYKESDSQSKYYVNKKGNQIVISEEGTIRLLDAKGYTIESDISFTNSQIDKFSIRETQLRDSKGLVIN